MPADKTRIGPRLRLDKGFLARETFLRVEPRVDLFIREKWLDEADADAKLPVILLHGAGMDSTGFDVPVENASLVDALARNGSRTFAFDFRGHGRSSRVADGFAVTVETSIVDTLAVLDYVQEVTGVERAVLVGVSYGTIVAAAVAERAPERVAGLVLLGLIYQTTGVSLEGALEEAAQAPAGYAFTTEEEWPELFIPSASPAVTAWHQAHFGTAYAYPVGPYFEVQKLPHATALHRFAGRVLVITGELDPFATEADVAAFLLAVGTPDEKKEHLHQPGIGHMPYVEADLTEVQDAINTFVDAATLEGQDALSPFVDSVTGERAETR
jgi:pimeloyl-ACP methyl ester carboxylesterase